MPQQVGHLLEGRDGREIFDEVSAPVDEPAVGAINLADLGFGGDHPFQPGAEVRHRAKCKEPRSATVLGIEFPILAAGGHNQ